MNALKRLQSITTGVRPRIPGQESPQHYEFGFSHLEWLNETNDLVVYHLGNLGWNKHEGRVGIALKPKLDIRVVGIEHHCVI